MTPKPAILRAAAQRDVDEATEHYIDSGGPDVALGFIGAFEAAIRHISRHPRSGSSRYGLELNLPGLRSWPLESYPHVVFYMEARTRIDAWRVLHGRRDIPETLRPREAQQ